MKESPVHRHDVDIDDFGRCQPRSPLKDTLDSDFENSPSAGASKRNRNLQDRRGDGIGLASSPSVSGGRTGLHRRGNRPSGGESHHGSPAQVFGTTSMRPRTLSRIPGLVARPRLSSSSAKEQQSQQSGSMATSTSSPERRVKSPTESDRNSGRAISPEVITFGGSHARNRSFSFNAQKVGNDPAHVSVSAKQSREPRLPPPNSLRSRHGVRVNAATVGPATRGKSTVQSNELCANAAEEAPLSPSEPMKLTAQRQSPAKQLPVKTSRIVPSPELKQVQSAAQPGSQEPSIMPERTVTMLKSQRPQLAKFLQTPEAKERALKRLSGQIPFPMTGRILAQAPGPSSLRTIPPASTPVQSSKKNLAKDRSNGKPDASPPLAVTVADESIDIRAMPFSPEPESPVVLSRLLPTAQSTERDLAATSDISTGSADLQSSSDLRHDLQSFDAADSSMSPSTGLTCCTSPPRLESDEISDLRRKMHTMEKDYLEMCHRAQTAEKLVSEHGQAHEEHLIVLEEALCAAEERATAAEVEMRSLDHTWRTKLDEQTDQTARAAEEAKAQSSASVEKCERKYAKVRSLAANSLISQALSGWTNLAPAARCEAQTAADQMETCRLLLGNLDLIESFVLQACPSLC